MSSPSVSFRIPTPGAVLVLLLAGAVVMMAGAGQPARRAKTTLGKELDTAHENVVAVFADRPGRSPATGTVVGPMLVLTAGHVTPRPSTPGLPAWIVAFGPHVEGAREVRLDPSTSSEPHPSFLAFVDEHGRNPNERADFLDAGLLVLPAPVANVKPMALPAAGLLDRLSPREEFVAVGYGYHEISREADAGQAGLADGNRRHWRVGVKVLNAGWMKLEDDPAKGYGQICRGDSGAPILRERGGQEMLVGIVSHSDGQGCGPGIPTYALRVDNPAVLDWIQHAQQGRGLSGPR